MDVALSLSLPRFVLYQIVAATQFSYAVHIVLDAGLSIPCIRRLGETL